MSGQITVWGASELLMTYFAKLTSPPPSFWLALIKDIAPTPYVSGAELDEPTNADYARIEIINDEMNWSNESAPQEVYNLLEAQFVTATSDWGVINFWALCNASTDGYNLLVGSLDTPILINTGDQAMLTEGDLSVSLGPFFLNEDE